MKPSKSLIAAAVVALLPFAAIAGDKDKAPAPMGTKARAQFDALDTNRDGRISRTEASSDSKIEFASLDKNGDGFLDSMEFSHRDMSHDPTTHSIPSSPDTGSKTDPNQPQATQPSTPRPDEPPK
jgi:hypothetical protein